jgi:hypothetical protein
MTAADAPTAFVVDYDAGLRVSIPKTAEIGAFVEPGWNRSQEGPYGALWEVGGCGCHGVLQREGAGTITTI